VALVLAVALLSVISEGNLLFPLFLLLPVPLLVIQERSGDLLLLRLLPVLRKE